MSAVTSLLVLPLTMFGMSPAYQLNSAVGSQTRTIMAVTGEVMRRSTAGFRTSASEANHATAIYTEAGTCWHTSREPSQKARDHKRLAFCAPRSSLRRPVLPACDRPGAIRRVRPLLVDGGRWWCDLQHRWHVPPGRDDWAAGRRRT